MKNKPNQQTKLNSTCVKSKERPLYLYASYTANKLNQYNSRTVPAYVDMLGIANPTASVTVNGNTAYRKGEYFHYALNTPNSSTPWFNTVTIASTFSPGQSSSGNLFVPQTPEYYDDPATTTIDEGYDADGNQLRDGRWDYTWDGENRLVKMESRSGAPTGSKLKLEFGYDYQSRRIQKKVSGWVSGNWSLTTDLRFVYDGWNLLAILNPQSSILRTFVWGTDLSGTMQGAGGVGGLLMLTDPTTINSQPSTHFATYDGNGNLAALVNAADGVEAARYEYGPFGEPIRSTGVMAKANPFRFSTKFTDDESGMLYYGYRSYNPSTGRWLSRDPLEEVGGINLYGFNFNDPIDRVDTDGRGSITSPPAQRVLYQELLETIASNMNMPLQQVIRRISLCSGIHAAYKALNCKGCRGWGCLTKNEAAKRSTCLAQEVGLRATYLRLKCDYFLPGSVAAGSAAKEKSHQGELINKTSALVECTAKAAP